jgi:hypothetical protein
VGAHYGRVVVANLLAFFDITQRNHHDPALKARVRLAGVVKEVGHPIELDKLVLFNLKRVVGANGPRLYRLLNFVAGHTLASHLNNDRTFLNIFWFRDLGIEAPSTTYYFEGGISSMVRHYNQYQKPIHDTVFYCEKEQDNVGVEIALQYVDDITAI